MQQEPVDNFQPPDIEEDREAMMEAWFDQQEKYGMVVVHREELKRRIDQECTDAYAEGRAEYTELMAAVEQILDAGHMNQEDLARLRSAWEAL